MQNRKRTDVMVWKEFQEKLEQDLITESDFTAEMGAYLQPLLCGEAAGPRRRKFLEAPYEIYEGTERILVVLHCPDDDYRFDFLFDGISWKLAFVECITLPVYDMDIFPYTEFAPLGKKELHIRREKEITQYVYFYLKFKELVGREKALACFSDGKGEYICARSWVPFYSDRLSYIAYCAWYECRINGENVVIREFQENKSEVVIYNHIWRQVYFTVGHLKPVIEFSDYMDLFEFVWKDRAASAGWKVRFVYTDEYTSLIFNS